MSSRVIVTGASSGIGRATATRLASDGGRICQTARREALLRDLAESLPGDGHLVVAGDMADEDTARRIAEAVTTEWGGVDSVVHCAGLFDSAHPIDSPLGVWRAPFDTMVNGAVYLLRAVAPLLSSGGRIVIVTSIHGDRVEAGGSAYAMAKAALNQYCRALALELAPNGILVNAIAPGFVDTPMSVVDGRNELESQWFRDNYGEGHHLPLRRAGTPAEIAGVAAFLLSRDSSYITGQVLSVDGGLSITF